MSPEDKYENTLYELEEIKAELERHHRDFERISTIVGLALGAAGGSDAEQGRFYRAALRDIRNIVG